MQKLSLSSASSLIAKEFHTFSKANLLLGVEFELAYYGLPKGCTLAITPRVLHVQLFYIQTLGNRIHCVFISTFFCIVVSKEVFFCARS